ncbi:hypothetical protein [Legionella sp. PC997]|uniref:hypothetical protein n=1 Tax=Legionella sp. PC997 TaxID=2755562 RepID=UPI0015F898A4|nr:hypothetical protein [Legionella sp. PC997]QMT60850.1 hypothetical protein HBNCFIEN_02238 [Legionella sp. PC997]
MLKKIDSNLPKQKIVLFIPFTASENNFSLYIRALDWRYNLRTSEDKSDKIPSIVMYQDPEEKEEDYEYYDQAQFHFNKENLGGKAKIYILADGTGDPEHVININQAYYQYLSQEPYQLSIHSMAWRLKQSGLTSELAQSVSAINLYICDHHNTNKQLAVYFGQGLGEHYKDTTINYYSAEVYIPSLVSLDGFYYETKKLAYFYHNTILKAGYAHEHKHTLKVSDTLMQPSSPNATDSLNSKARALPTFKETVSDASSVSVVEILDSESTEHSLMQGTPTITFPDEELDITYGTEAESQTEVRTSSTALIVRQDRSMISFFKDVKKVDSQNHPKLQDDFASLTF